MLSSSMDRGNDDEQKVVWLSPRKLVFEWETEVGHHFPWGYEVTGKKKILVIAEEGKDLYFLEDGGFSTENDVLCFFCDYGIDLRLVHRGDVPSCLLGKDCGWVKFCRYFTPGPTFGQNKKKDMGERRRRAEKILQKIIWEHCIYCEHWNTKNVVKTYREGGTTFIESDYKNAFCEIRERPHHWKTPCRNFKLTKDQKKRAQFERQKSKLREYIRELKENKKLEQRKTIVC